MAKKCTKKRNAHAKLFFCQSKPIAIVVIQKFCSHGNVTSHFSSLSIFPMKIPGEFDPLSSHRPHLGIMAWPALGKQGYQLVYRILHFSGKQRRNRSGRRTRESSHTRRNTRLAFFFARLKKSEKIILFCRPAWQGKYYRNREENSGAREREKGLMFLHFTLPSPVYILEDVHS